jgi:ABC-type transporter MlaC component
LSGAYLSKIQLADAERFAYLGDTTKDDHAVVRTRITTNNGTVIPVNYRARMTEGGTWRVYDLDVGGEPRGQQLPHSVQLDHRALVLSRPGE